MSKVRDASYLFVIALAAALVLAYLPTRTAQTGSGPTPDPALGPSSVVQIQLDALRRNNSLNDGIALTYRFASPGNKGTTGPLLRFSEIFNAPPYEALLNHATARVGPISIAGRQAYQAVMITDRAGNDFGFVWVLVRQNSGEFAECWMTDGVIPTKIPPEGRVRQWSAGLFLEFPALPLPETIA